MQQKILTFTLATAAAASLATASSHAATDPVSSMFNYIGKYQAKNGGIKSTKTTKASLELSNWTVLALVENGRDPKAFKRVGGTSVKKFIKVAAAGLDIGTGYCTFATKPTSGQASVQTVARTMIALRAAKYSQLTIRKTGSNALLDVVKSKVDSTTGSVCDSITDTAWALMAMKAAGLSNDDPKVVAARKWLKGQANASGGFSEKVKGTGADNVDTTGFVIQALLATGTASSEGVVTAAAKALRAAENSDGGFPTVAGEKSNSRSTFFAATALTATGADPNKIGVGSNTASAYAVKMVTGSSSVKFNADGLGGVNPVLLRAQLLTAVLLKPLPLLP